MMIQQGNLRITQELQTILSDIGGENPQVCFPSKTAVKKMQVIRAHSIEKNPWKF